MSPRSWLRVLGERDRDLMEEADAEYAMNDAEFQRWILRQWRQVDPLDHDPADDAYRERDRADRLEAEGGLL